MNEDMLVRMKLDGTVVERSSRAPSSEIKMHLRVYQENPSVMGVVHAHPVYATSFAIAGIPLDESILSEAMLQIGAIGVAHYAEPGTYDVPDSIAPFCKDYAAVLMSNHGALAWGTSLDEAYTRMEAWRTTPTSATSSGNWAVAGSFHPSRSRGWRAFASAWAFLP